MGLRTNNRSTFLAYGLIWTFELLDPRFNEPYGYWTDPKRHFFNKKEWTAVQLLCRINIEQLNEKINTWYHCTKKFLSKTIIKRFLKNTKANILYLSINVMKYKVVLLSFSYISKWVDQLTSSIVSWMYPHTNVKIENSEFLFK